MFPVRTLKCSLKLHLRVLLVMITIVNKSLHLLHREHRVPLMDHRLHQGGALYNDCCYLCIYCMEGYCVHSTSVPLCSMNNKTMVQRPGVLKISSFTVLYYNILCCTISSLDIIDNLVPTSAIFAINQPKSSLTL